MYKIFYTFSSGKKQVIGRDFGKACVKGRCECHGHLLAPMIACMGVLLPIATTELPKEFFRRPGRTTILNQAIVDFNSGEGINLPRKTGPDFHDWSIFLKMILKNGFNPVIPIDCIQYILEEGENWGPPTKPDFAQKSEEQKVALTTEWKRSRDEWAHMNDDRLYRQMSNILAHVKRINPAHYQILITTLEFAAIFCELAVQIESGDNQNMTPYVFGPLLSFSLMRECNGCCKPGRDYVDMQKNVWPKFIEYSIMRIREYIHSHGIESIFEMKQIRVGKRMITIARVKERVLH